MRAAVVALLLAATGAQAAIKPTPIRKGATAAEVRLADLDDEILLCAAKGALTRMEFRNRTIAAEPKPAYESGWRVTWGPRAFSVQPVSPVPPAAAAGASPAGAPGEPVVEYKAVPHRTDMDVYLTSGEVVSVVLDTCRRSVRVVRVTLPDAAAPVAATPAAPAPPPRNWRYSFVLPTDKAAEARAQLAPDAVSDDGQTMCIQYAAGRMVPAFYVEQAGSWTPVAPTVAGGCILLPVQARVLAAVGGLVGGIAREDAIVRPPVPEPATMPMQRVPR